MAQIADLLNFVLRSTYFQYNRSKEQDGAAMGSPVSAVIANLCMEIFEEQGIASALCQPKFWKRYVDDTFTIMDRDSVDDFIKHTLTANHRFTLESERDKKIAYLDTSVLREPDGRLTTSVNRQPTTLSSTSRMIPTILNQSNAVLLSVCTTGRGAS